MTGVAVVICGTGLCMPEPCLASVYAGASVEDSPSKVPSAAPKVPRFKLLNKFSGRRVSGRVVLKVALFDESDGGDINLFFDDSN